MNELLALVGKALNDVDPKIAGLVLVSIPIVKVLVEMLKKFVWKNMQGNVVQTIAALVSIIVMVAESASIGTFSDGVTVREAIGIALASLLVFCGSVGFDQIWENTNDPKIHPKPGFNAPPPGESGDPSKISGDPP